jgi:hypothetical protein
MLLGHPGGDMDSSLELAHWLNDVISWRYEHDRGRIAASDEGRAQPDAGSGIAATRFAYDPIGR